MFEKLSVSQLKPRSSGFLNADPNLMRSLDQLDEIHKKLIVIDLADHLENILIWVFTTGVTAGRSRITLPNMETR